MGRTPGAKNRSPRELRTEAKHLNEKAKLKERLEKARREGKKRK